MSHRGKRPSRSENDGPPPIKRRKGRPPLSATAGGTVAVANDDEDAAVVACATVNVAATHGTSSSKASHQNSGSGAGSSTSKNWQLRQMTDLKLSSIYNRNAPEAPAELFRKDLISAMKLPDSEPLAHDEYWVIGDQWKQEWERGVQVPVNPDSLPEPSVRVHQSSTIYKGRSDFKLPKNKYIRITKDESFSSELHYLSNAPAMADAACSYDLDQCDEAWLKLMNGERVQCALPPVTEEQFERVVEELETRCWDKIQAIMKSEEGLGIEYDENVICDVCRSPDSEEANEMVFCDNCNICVHQACYGITVIPPGQWMCRTCDVGQRPDCVLCPNKGGAMKSTRSGQKWAHVSCALWIPEVSIGSVDRMEPITKISSIPQSRWALLCVLCRERVGACIQCSVKTCKTAYHVTCAFQHGLEMRAIIEDEHAEDGVKLRSYCLKHSKRDKGGNSASANAFGSDDDDVKRKKQRKDMTTEERNQARIQRLQEVEADFDKHVNVKDISCHLLEVDQEGIHTIYNYWILKRKSMNNRPLLPPKSEDVDVSCRKQGQADVEKMKMFVHLRQDLERVRNLCYMVSRREKLSRSFFKMREQTFHKQMTLLMDFKTKKVDETLVQAVLQANHGPSIYDRLYSARQVTIPSKDKWEQIVERLTESVGSGGGVDVAKGSTKASATDLNGVTRDAKGRHHGKKKPVFNGATARRASTYVTSMSSDSESSAVDMLHSITSPSVATLMTTPTTKKGTVGRPPKNTETTTKTDRRKKRINSTTTKSKIPIDTSSEEEDEATSRKINDKQRSPRNRTLRQMAREMSNDKSHFSASDESDELLPIRNSGGVKESRGKMSAIYSDSDSTDKDRTDNGASDSQQHVLRTKAAMKAFVPPKSKGGDSKSLTADVDTSRDKSRDKSKQLNKTAKQDNSNKSPTKSMSASKKDFLTDLLVVPQRQAAKKASENMKSTVFSAAQSTAQASSSVMTGKKENKEVKVEETVASIKERRDSAITAVKEDRTVKSTKGKTPKSSSTKVSGKEKTAEAENKELLEKLAYVPQRQAAKKAAEHIKSGLGKPQAEPTSAATDEAGKPVKVPVSTQKKTTDEGKKNAQQPVVISSSSSSYSGSSSSSSSTSTSSSESDDEAVDKEKKAKITKDSRTANNRARDLPFLDKDTKSMRSVSSSTSTESDSEGSSGASSDSTSNNNNRNKKNASKRIVAEGKLKSGGLGRPSAGSTSGNNSGVSSAKDDGASAKGGSAKVAARSSKRASVSSDRRRSVERDKSGALDKVPESSAGEDGKRRKASTVVAEELPERQSSRTDGEITSSPIKSHELSPEKRKVHEKVNAAAKESPSSARRSEPSPRQKTPSAERRKSRTPSEENKEPQFKSPERKSRDHPPKPSPNREEITTNSKSRSVTPTKRDTPSPLKRATPTVAEELPVVLSPYNKQSTPTDVKAETEIPGGEKRPSSRTDKVTQKSIFSPLPPSSAGQPPTVSTPASAKTKDPCAFFDFTDDLLPSVTETINDDTFHVQSDTAENLRNVGLSVPLAHTTDILFKEDYKEDSEKETMNLVEKLRQKFKRSQSTASSAPSDASNQEQKVSQIQDVPEIVENKVNEVIPLPNVDNTTKHISPDVVKLPVELTNFQSNASSKFDSLQQSEMQQMPKSVSDSMDHSGSIHLDDRWIPPSAAAAAAELTQTNLAHLTQMMFDPKMMSAQAAMEEIVSQSLVASAGNNADFLKQFQERMEFQTSQCIQLHQQQSVITSEADAHQQVSKPQISHPKSLEYDDNSSIQSPYSVHPSNWVESEMIPTRRSVSSSPASSTSEGHEMKPNQVMPQQQQRPTQQDNVQLHHSAHRNIMDMPPFMNIQPFPPVSAASNHNAPSLENIMPPYNYPEASGGFTGPVTLFPPPTGMNVQLPLHSPGAAMYPPAFGQSFTTAPNAQPPTSLCGLQKPPGEMLANTIPSYPANPCGAAFTSSSQNMALTAAMVSPTPAPVNITSPQATQQLPGNRFQTPNNDCLPANLSQQPFSAQTPLQSPAQLADNLSGKATPRQVNDEEIMKSPPKPNRMSKGGQTKSPGKSPAKSPRQQQIMDINRHISPANKVMKPDPVKVKKVRNPTAPSGGRGRGRGRGRGGKTTMHHFPPMGVPEFDFMTGGTNHSKLAGTVYDFDEELAGESVENLKAMRDRRRSSDYRTEPFRSGREVTSPKFASPNAHSKQSRSIPPPPPFTTADISNLRPPSPVRTTQTPVAPPTTSLRDIVQPVLPGPVDMRTYNTGFETTESYNNHLLRAFASGTADQTLADIDEEMEKELQSALKASSTKPKEPEKVIEAPPVAPVVEEHSQDADSNKPKVSLSDSRNQLKLKIKGPLAHPDNYNTPSTVRHPPQQIDQAFPPTSTNCTLSSIATSGSSNFHRMRKKELLRQYCSQDMNTVDAHAGLPSGVDHSASLMIPQFSRSVGIPKAVDSMSSIPTKEDYKDYAATVDLKKKKKLPVMSRELRQLDISAYDMNDDDNSRMQFDLSMDFSAKRRARGNSNTSNKVELTPGDVANAAPKLKIKLGQSIIDVNQSADKRLSGRPPKKRLSQNIPMPNMEDIKRDCMNYRKLVMADFEEKEKTVKPKKVKPSKEEKRKKKKEKKHKFEIINNGNNSDTTPKLIIRLGKKKGEDGLMTEPQIPQDPSEFDPNAVDPLALDEPAAAAATAAEKGGKKKLNATNANEKILTPIRLKIARSNQGKSYVMSEKKEGAAQQQVDDGKKTEKVVNNPSDGGQQNCTDAKGKKVKDAEQNLDVSKTSEGKTPSAGNILVSSNPGDRAKKPSVASEGGRKASGSSEKESNVVKAEEKGGKSEKKDSDTTANPKGCPALPLNKDCEVR